MSKDGSGFSLKNHPKTEHIFKTLLEAQNLIRDAMYFSCSCGSTNSLHKPECRFDILDKANFKIADALSDIIVCAYDHTREALYERLVRELEAQVKELHERLDSDKADSA